MVPRSPAVRQAAKIRPVSISVISALPVAFFDRFEL
jgi:hypothetical protein